MTDHTKKNDLIPARRRWEKARERAQALEKELRDEGLLFDNTERQSINLLLLPTWDPTPWDLLHAWTGACRKEDRLYWRVADLERDDASRGE